MGATVLFDRYRLLDRAGRGGMADVWHAIDTRTGNDVAVKRLHPIVFASRPGRDRLLREFRAVRSLDHPNIVRVRDLELTANEGALILDYVAGPSIRDRLRDGPPMNHDEALAIIGAAAAGLAEAHRHGIVHRDVTPGNVLLDERVTARLTDFGIAQGSSDASTMTGTGQLVGTLAYLAPEQLRGEPATTASDLFSLAAVTYQLLTGRLPFEATTPVGLVEAHRQLPPSIDRVPGHVDEAVRRALSVEPSDRQRSVDEFMAELRAPIAATPAARPVPAGKSVRPVAGLIAVGFGALVLAALALGGPGPGGEVDAPRGSTSPTLSQPDPTPAPEDPEQDGGGNGRGNGNGNGNGGGGGNGNGNGNGNGGDDGDD